MNNLAFLFLLATLSSASVAENIVNSMAGSSEFVISLYYVVGLAMIFAGVNQLKKLGNRTAFMNADSGVVGPVVRMSIGAILIFLPSFFEVLNNTFWGNPAFAAISDIQWPQDSADSLSVAMKPVIVIIQFIGLVAMLRGFLILSKATGQGAQPGTISKGFVHVFGGILAVNIVRTVEVVVATFGVS